MIYPVILNYSIAGDFLHDQILVISWIHEN